MRKHEFKRRYRFSMVFKWGGLAALAFTLFAVLGDQGLLKLHQMRLTEAQLGQMVHEVRAENNRLAIEIERLKETPYLEKVVREELGFLRPDEVVYYVHQRP